jgi:hypothetical protein
MRPRARSGRPWNGSSSRTSLDLVATPFVLGRRWWAIVPRSGNRRDLLTQRTLTLTPDSTTLALGSDGEEEQ